MKLFRKLFGKKAEPRRVRVLEITSNILPEAIIEACRICAEEYGWYVHVEFANKECEAQSIEFDCTQEGGSND